MTYFPNPRTGAPASTSPTTTATAVAADGTEVPLILHRPTRPHGRLVWAHGGSWRSGSAADWANSTAALSSLSGWAVVSVDYRLAPVHPYPAAILDTLAALDRADAWAGQQPVAVGGDSAGGTIAASAAVARRNSGGPAPPQVLAYPPLDPKCTAASYIADPAAFPDRAALRDAWGLWLGSDTCSHPFVPTPFHASDLTGLAPVALVVGDRDPVRGDLREYYGRLQEDGVPTTLRVLPGVRHADFLNPRGPVTSALASALTGMERTSGSSDRNFPPATNFIPERITP